MGFWDKMLGRDAPGEVALVGGAPEAPQTFVVEVKREFLNTAALESAGLRNQEWVMTAEGLGIIVGCDIDANTTVALVKEDGKNRMRLNDEDKPERHTIILSLAGMRRAYLDEIPAARHPDVDHESHMRSFGFIHSSEAQ